MAGSGQFVVLDMQTSDGPEGPGAVSHVYGRRERKRPPALQSDYPPQNARMAFCSAPMLANPSAAAAALSPPSCKTSAETLRP